MSLAGDVLQINSFPSNYQLVWSYSGNPDDVSLDIVGVLQQKMELMFV